MTEFKSFREIKNYKNGLYCRITEKIHGSNAQILIEETTDYTAEDLVVMVGGKTYVVKAGSRTKWLAPGKQTDNYGFASWVSANIADLVDKLGPGRHYGEWYGAGINSGYNLKEKRFILFNSKDFLPGRPLPPGVDVVPLLFEGAYSELVVEQTTSTLKEQGSRLVAGFMKPEGIVIDFPAFGHCLKKVFEPEETGWRAAPHKGVGKLADLVDKEEVMKRLQPIRLEKLLSRDSQYKEQYPESLPRIAADYMADLEKEGQLEGADDATVKAIKRGLWPWLKEMMK